MSFPTICPWLNKQRQVAFKIVFFCVCEYDFSCFYILQTVRVSALIRDESKIQRVQSTSKPIIYMFTAAGRELANIRVSINWTVS